MEVAIDLLFFFSMAEEQAALCHTLRLLFTLGPVQTSNLCRTQCLFGSTRIINPGSVYKTHLRDTRLHSQ